MHVVGTGFTSVDAISLSPLLFLNSPVKLCILDMKVIVKVWSGVQHYRFSLRTHELTEHLICLRSRGSTQTKTVCPHGGYVLVGTQTLSS